MASEGIPLAGKIEEVLSIVQRIMSEKEEITEAAEISTSGSKRKMEEKEETAVEGSVSSEKEEKSEGGEDEYSSDEDIIDEPRPGPYRKEIYYDSSDSDDYLTDAYKDYARAITESRGYDVPERPPNLKISDNIIHTYNFKLMGELSQTAIEFYNEQNGTNYVFDRVVKANKQPARGILYYITFKASGAEGIMEFQAQVLDGIPDVEVYECQLNPNPSPSTSPSSDSE